MLVLLFESFERSSSALLPLGFAASFTGTLSVVSSRFLFRPSVSAPLAEVSG